MSLVVLVYKNDWEGEYFVADEHSPAVLSLLHKEDVNSEVVLERAFPEQESIILEHYLNNSGRFRFKKASEADWYLASTVA